MATVTTTSEVGSRDIARSGVRAVLVAWHDRLVHWFDAHKWAIVQLVDRVCWWIIGGAVGYVVAQLIRRWMEW